MILSVSSDRLEALSRFAAPSNHPGVDSVPGVLVTPAPEGGIHMVATDGYAMAMFHDPEGTVSGGDQPCGGVILRAVAIKALGSQKLRTLRSEPKKGRAKHHRRVVLSDWKHDLKAVDGGGYELSSTPAMFHPGPFPDYQNALKYLAEDLASALIPVWLSAQKVARFAFSYSFGNPDPGIAFFQADEGPPGPILVFREDADDFLGAIMPRRSASIDVQKAEDLARKFCGKPGEAEQ